MIAPGWFKVLSATGLLVATALPVSPSSQMHIETSDPRVQRVGALWLFEGRPFSGELEESADDGSHTQRPVMAGRVEGTLRAWYADGRLKSERAYVQGRKDGMQREWWPDGKLRLQSNMRADVPVGESRTWYAGGAAYEAHFYDAAGHESGLQQVWYEDGSLRANYEVRGGRRFGTVGPKACTGKDKT